MVVCVFVVGSCESSGIGISRSQQGERDIGIVAERDETTAATDAGTPSNKRKRPHVRHSHPHPHPHSLLHSHTRSKSLQNLKPLDGAEVQERVRCEVERERERVKEVVEQHKVRLIEQQKAYQSLEDEFRMALRIEATRYQEVCVCVV